MNRLIILYAISLILGILISSIFNSILIISAVSILIALTIMLFFNDNKLYYYVAIIFLLVGALEYIIINNTNIDKYKDSLNHNIIIQGKIDSEPDIRPSKVMYVIKTQKIINDGQEKKISGKILLSTMKKENSCFLSYGQEIRILGQINIPRPQSNLNGFDYRRYLASKGISATVFAPNENIKISKSMSGNKIIVLGLNIRNRIISVINRCLPEKQAGLLNGILIGYKEGLNKEIQGQFSSAGLTHIMAVSGANVVFVMMPFLWIFNKIGINKRLANIIVIFILLLFVTITGFQPSVMRAVIMSIVVLLAQIIYKEPDILASIAFSAIVMLVYNPYVLFDIGFELSYAATLGIVLFYKNIRNRLEFLHLPKILLETIATTLAAQLAVLPIIAYYFNKITVISLISNLLVVPIIGVITVLGEVIAILGQISIFLVQILCYIENSLLSFVLLITEKASDIPFATITIITPSILIVCIYYVFIAGIFNFRQLNKIDMKLKYLVILGVFISILFFVNSSSKKELEIVFLDVGQGDSIFARTISGKTLLIDGGGYNSMLDLTTNKGDSVVIPFLLDYGVQKIDLMISTHSDSDHMQGLMSVLRDVVVQDILLPANYETQSYDEFVKLAKEKNVRINKGGIGDVIQIDNDTKINVEFPCNENEFYSTNENNKSLVFKLIYKSFSTLFTGDAEIDAENFLIAKGIDLKSDILKVSHHGSISSSQDSFIEAVNPKVAIISVGKNNFGHPSPVVINRLKEHNILVFRTDLDGGIIIDSDGSSYKIRKILR